MSYTPPESVASAARRGMRLREKVKAGTPVGIARARDLSNRRPVSLETIGRMVSFFARHGAQRPDDIGTDAEPTPWLVAWLLWGGDAGREWAERVWEREGMARTWTAMRWAELPAGVALRNPKALHVGRPFRTLTADASVRDGTSGAELGRLPIDDLREMVRVFDARLGRGEGAPRIDYNHGPSNGGRPEVYGEVLALYVAEDERGAGLYVVPGWTDHGREFVRQHATPSGDSLLSNSPEFRVGDAFARGGEGERLGGAELYAVALTPTPQQAEAIIDTVRLSTTAALGAEGGEGMDPEEIVAQLQELAAKFDRLAESHAEVVKRLDAHDAKMAEAAAEVVEGRVEELATEAVSEALASQAPEAIERQMAETSAALAAADDDEEKKAMGQRLTALTRGLTVALSRSASERIAALEAEVERTKRQRLADQRGAAVDALVAQGLPPAERESAAALWSLDHDPEHAAARRKLWAAGVKTPWEQLCDRVQAGEGVVPQGVAGVRGDAAPVDEVSVIRAWAKENGMDFDARPAETARRYNIAKKGGFR